MVNSESMDSSGDGKPKDYITQLNSGGGSAGISIDTHSPSPVTASCVRLRDMDFDANESAADITSAECANPIDSLPETAVTHSIHEENFRLTQQTESEISSLYCSVPLNKVQDVLSSYSVDSPSAAEDCGDVKNNKKSLPRRLLCLYCDRTFVTSNLRQKHVDRCHSVKQARRSSSRFQTRFTTACIFCKKLNNTDHSLNDLFKHLVERHSNKYFACVTCEERFVFKAHLEEHNQQNHEQKGKARVQDEVSKVNSPTVALEASSVEDETNTLKTKHKTKIKRDTADSDNREDLVVNRPNLRMSVRKELRKKKVGVKSTKTGVKRNTRLQTKVTNAQTKTPVKKRTKSRHEKSLELSEKPASSVNPYPTFDAFFRVKKITDHSIDNLKISSLTFDDVFDKAFYNRIKCNIQENLQNHIDGKLFKNEESESRISNFEKNRELNSSPTENFGCDISLNAATPVVSLLSSQLGEDFESQIEYGAKASKKKPPPKQDEVHYKYFTRRKYQASILESKENRDLSKLDMWTQLVVKDRQQAIINDKKTEKEKIEYTKGIEYRTKMQNAELNRILDRRGPFEDLKEEANKKAALEKYNRLGESVSCEAISDVACILNDLVDRVFECSENPIKMEVNETTLEEEKPRITDEDCEIPFYLNLRRNSSLIDQPDVDKSDRITLICSSQETENFEEITTPPRDKNTLVELTGEWTRTRIYICAACGVKVPNMKHLVDHKSVYHQNVWVQHYEFVGNQSVLYKHLSIPGLGRVGHVEEVPMPKSWRRSDSRLCTKCSRMCNTLGELHRHMLECGEDWSWMLARKKLKYRPFGAKSRRKRRGLVKRIIHKEKSGDEVREKRKYNVKRYDGPRPKPSDAETIQRMLANLPAKRATRKLISLKDGFPKQIRRKATQKSKNNTINTNAKTSTKNQTSVSNLKTQTLTGRRGRKKKGLTCNPMILRKSMRNINKIFSSKILDSNSTLLVKRKIKTVLQHQRITRARKMLMGDDTVEDKTATNTTCPKKKGLIDKVKMLTKAVKRTVLKKDEKKIENNGSASNLNTNNAATSAVNKSLTRTTRQLKKSDSLEDTITDIINSIDTGGINSDKNKENISKKKIDDEQLPKSESENSAKMEVTKKKPKLIKKETAGTKLARTLSLRKLRKKNTEDEKLKTQSNPELNVITPEEKVKNGKRKSTLDNFKNKIKKIKLKDKAVPHIAQVDGSSQISDEILPFLENIHIDSDEIREKNVEESKNTEPINEGVVVNEVIPIEVSPVEQQDVCDQELVNNEVNDLNAVDQPKLTETEELVTKDDDVTEKAENCSNHTSDTDLEVTAKQPESSLNNDDNLVTENLPEKSDESASLHETDPLQQNDFKELDSNIESNAGDAKSCTNANKIKSKKRFKGLNDCIAMLTSKLQQKVEEVQVNSDVVDASDNFDVVDSSAVHNKEMPSSETIASKQLEQQEEPVKEISESNHSMNNSKNVIADQSEVPKMFEANHKIVENLEKNREELVNLQTRFIAEQQQLLLQHIYRQLPNYQYNYIPTIPREANFLINNIMFNGQNQIGEKYLQLNQNPDHNVAKFLGSIDRNHKFKEVDVNIEFDIMKYLGNVADNCVVKLENLKNKSNDSKKKSNNKAGSARRCNNKRKENINVMTSNSKEPDGLSKVISEKSFENDEFKHKKLDILKQNDKFIDTKVNEKAEDLTQCHNSKKSLDMQSNKFISSHCSNTTAGKAFIDAEVSTNGGEVIDLIKKNNMELGKDTNLFEQLTRNGISIALFPSPQVNQKKCEISTDKIEAIDLKINKPHERTADNFKLSTELTKMENLISLPNKFDILSDTQAAINLKVNRNLETSKKDLIATQEDKNAADVNTSIFKNKGLFAANALIDKTTFCPKFSVRPFFDKNITPFTPPKPAKSFQSVFEESYKLLNIKPPKRTEKKKKTSKSFKSKLGQSNLVNSFSGNNEKSLLSKNELHREIIDFKIDKIPIGNAMNVIKPSKDFNLVFQDQKFPQTSFNINSNQVIDLKINKTLENEQEIKQLFSKSNMPNPLVSQSISKEAHPVSLKSDIKNAVKEKKRIILKPPQFIATSLEKRPIIENVVLPTFQTKPESLNVTITENITTHQTNGITKNAKTKCTVKSKNVDDIECKIKSLLFEEKEPDVMEEKTLKKINSSRSNSKERQTKDTGILQETTCEDVSKKPVQVSNKSDTDSDDDIPLANLLKETQKKIETQAEASTDIVPAELPNTSNMEELPTISDNVPNIVCNSSVLDIGNDKLETNLVQPIEEVASEIQSNLIPAVTMETQAETVNEDTPCECEEAKTNNKKPRIRKRNPPGDKKEKVKKKPGPVKTPKAKGTPLYDETDPEFLNKAARKIKISCQIFQKSSKIVLDKNIFDEAEQEEEEETTQLPPMTKHPAQVLPIIETVLPDVFIKEELSTEPIPPPTTIVTEIVSKIKEELPEVEENDPEPEPVQSEQFFPEIPESTPSPTIEDLELEIRRRIKLSNLQLKRETIDDSQNIPTPINTDIIYEVDSSDAQAYNEETNTIALHGVYSNNDSAVENSMVDMNNEILPTDIATTDIVNHMAVLGDSEMHTSQNVDLLHNILFEQDTTMTNPKDYYLDYEKGSTSSIENIQDNIISNTREIIQNYADNTLIPENVQIDTEQIHNEPIAVIPDLTKNTETNFSDEIDNIKENATLITSLTDVEVAHDEENNTEMNFDVEREKEGDLPTENANTAPNLIVLEEYKQPPIKECENKSKKSKKKHEEVITDVTPAYGEFQVNTDQTSGGINKITISRKKLQVNHNSNEAIIENDIYVVKKIKKSRRKSTNNKDKKKRKSSLLLKENNIDNSTSDSTGKTVLDGNGSSLENHPISFEHNLENVEFEVQNEEIGRKLKINKKKIKEIPAATNLEAITTNLEQPSCTTNLESAAFATTFEPSASASNLEPSATASNLKPSAFGATNLEPSPFGETNSDPPPPAVAIESNITEDVDDADVVDGAKDYDDLPKDMEIEEFQVAVPIIETNFNPTNFDVSLSNNLVTHPLSGALSSEPFVSSQPPQTNVNKLYFNNDLLHDGFQVRDQKSPMPSILTYRSGLNDKVDEQTYNENFEIISKNTYFNKEMNNLPEKSLDTSDILIINSVYGDRFVENSNSKSLNVPYSINSVNSIEDLSANSAYDTFTNTQTYMNTNATPTDGNLINNVTISSSTTKKGRKSRNTQDKVHSLQMFDEATSLPKAENYEDSNKERAVLEYNSELQLDSTSDERDNKSLNEKVQPLENVEIIVDESKIVQAVAESIPRYDVNVDDVDSTNQKNSKKSYNKKNKQTKIPTPLLHSISSDSQTEEIRKTPKLDSSTIHNPIELTQNKKSKKPRTSRSAQENEAISSFDMMCNELQALCDVPLEVEPFNKNITMMEVKTNKDPPIINSDSDLSNTKDFSTSSSSFCDNIKSSCDAKINELLREIDSSPRLGKKLKKSKNAIAKVDDCDIAITTTMQKSSDTNECNNEEDQINKSNDVENVETVNEEEITSNMNASTAMETLENLSVQLDNLPETIEENIDKTTPSAPSSKPKTVKPTRSSKKKSIKAKKERSFSIENTEELYCDICDKMFARSENLVKHKRTLTHIAKLSEIEAKEAQAKANDVIVTATINQSEEQCYKMDINISDILNNSEKLNEQQQELNNEIANKIHVNSPFVLKTNSDTLKLADIINDVLNKPVENEKHTAYSDSHVSQTSSHVIAKNETKRYKSLGERKSFESDLKQTYPFNTIAVGNDPISKLSSQDTILKQQISILENIIETEGPFGYIDDITVSSSKSVEEPVTKSPSELSIMSKNDDSNQLGFTHNSSGIINNLIKPNIHSQTFIKPTQYEEISNDSSSVRNQFDDQRSRKVLNRDEELFLECCSLLKSSSEVSGYSKRSSRTVHVLNNFEMKQTDEEPEWLERKSFAPKNQEYKHDVFQNSCPNTPLGDGYGDDCSNTNSNTIVTDWSTKQKEKLCENPVFEDISLDSKGSTNIQQEINQFKAAERTFCDFQLFNTERDKNPGDNGECTSTAVGTESAEDNVNGKEADEDFKKKMVSRFGGLMAKAWRNSVQVVKKNKTKKKPSTEVTQTSITDYAVPLVVNAKTDNDPNDSKKMLTKGAMKVFEGLKVSIPTDDLDMKELLSTSHVTKKQEDELNTQSQEIISNESEPLKEDAKLPKNNNVKSFGNRLGLKVTKKKHTIIKPKELSMTDDPKDTKTEDENKKGHDVYDFEETQDNTDIFISQVTNIKEFRSKIAEKKNLSDCTSNKEPTPIEVPEESDSDSRQGGFIESYNYEAQSVSSLSTESSSSLRKTKKKNMTKKKCMIMGRIFKNAFKSKVEEDIRDIPSVDNTKLVEDYVMQLPQEEDKRPKLTEQEMDMLFDKLLEDKSAVEEDTKDVENPMAAITKPMEKPAQTAQPKQKPKNPPKRKRQRHNSDSTDDEFSLSKTKKRYNKKKPKIVDSSINLEQELKECIGVASRKSQRKCTSGKQNVLVEFWSSDDSNFEAFIKETALDKPKTIRTESKVKECCNHDENNAKPVEASAEEAFKDLADTIKKAMPKIETDNQKTAATQSVDDATPHKPDKVINAKQTRRKSSNCNKPRVKNDDDVEDKKMKNIKVTAETLAANRRKRAASNTLYYWSSSSDDESQDLIEIKPVRDELDEDEDRPMQHGWIVGDSPKKLVTMLAQAKGKKIDAESVKEQGKKRTTM